MVGKGIEGATIYKRYDTRVGTGCQGKSEARDAERTGLPQRHRGNERVTWRRQEPCGGRSFGKSKEDCDKVRNWRVDDEETGEGDEQRAGDHSARNPAAIGSSRGRQAGV